MGFSGILRTVVRGGEGSSEEVWGETRTQQTQILIMRLEGNKSIAQKNT